MKKVLIPLISLVLLAALAAGGFFGYEAYILSKAPEIPAAAEQTIRETMAQIPADASETQQGKALYEAYISSLSCRLEGQARQEGREAWQTVALSAMDIESLYEGLGQYAQRVLSQQVENAVLSSQVYNEDLSYKSELLELAANEAFYAALPNAKTAETYIELRLCYEDGAWQILNADELSAAMYDLGDGSDAEAARIMAAAVENPQYVRKTYTIEETATAGPEPDRSRFGSTDDPAVIEELIASPLAQQLINGQEPVWNSDIEFLPDTRIHYYLDETILTIVWQEEEARAVGTFAETFIADGSQLRRKIAGDRFEDFNHTIATDFAAQTNAVLALGGDLYHHGRNCGIVVYQREIYRFDPVTCDCCYITTDGDMLFSYRGQFSERSEAESFVEENDILFSVCFGPVLIDNGVDVTPDKYMWGEINEAYARSALGMLGDKHYLSMNLNCQQPDHYYLCTLRQAADAMVERGCIKAYALDGGQTASTVINNQLINPVQFGWQRRVSDIIYFATAVPNV